MDKRDLPYYNAAKKLGLKTVESGFRIGFYFVYDNIRCYVRFGMLPINFGSNCALCDKKTVNSLLFSNGLPVAHAVSISKNEYKVSKLEKLDISYPVVAKPLAGTALGKDVVCNIRNANELEKYLDKFINRHGQILIEKFYSGLTSYRALVLDDNVIGVTQRDSARITGDGKHTIDEIIEIKNRERKKIKGVSLGSIKKDQEFFICLNEQNLTLDSILQEGEEALLHYKCNSTTGGTMTGLPLSSICKENEKLLVEAAKVLGLRLAGFDVLCENISLPISKTKGIIVECNHFPDITIHEALMTGIVTPVAEKILLAFIKRNKLAYLKHKFHRLFGNNKDIFFKVKTLLLLFASIFVGKLMLT